MWCRCAVYVLRMCCVYVCVCVCGAYVVFPFYNFARWREPPRRPGVLLAAPLQCAGWRPASGGHGRHPPNESDDRADGTANAHPRRLTDSPGRSGVRAPCAGPCYLQVAPCLVELLIACAPHRLKLSARRNLSILCRSVGEETLGGIRTYHAASWNFGELR